MVGWPFGLSFAAQEQVFHPHRQRQLKQGPGNEQFGLVTPELLPVEPLKREAAAQIADWLKGKQFKDVLAEAHPDVVTALESSPESRVMLERLLLQSSLKYWSKDFLRIILKNGSSAGYLDHILANTWILQRVGGLNSVLKRIAEAQSTNEVGGHVFALDMSARLRKTRELKGMEMRLLDDTGDSAQPVDGVLMVDGSKRYAEIKLFGKGGANPSEEDLASRMKSFTHAYEQILQNAENTNGEPWDLVIGGSFPGLERLVEFIGQINPSLSLRVRQPGPDGKLRTIAEVNATASHTPRVIQSEPKLDKRAITSKAFWLARGMSQTGHMPSKIERSPFQSRAARNNAYHNSQKNSRH